jgi:hypothetical protein
MPIVGMETASVIRRAASSGIPSSTMQKAPALSIAFASSTRARTACGVFPCTR